MIYNISGGGYIKLLPAVLLLIGGLEKGDKNYDFVRNNFGKKRT